MASSMSSGSNSSFCRPGAGKKKERYDFYYYKGNAVAVKNHGPKAMFKHSADQAEYKQVSSNTTAINDKNNR